MNNKTVLITGANRGLGNALAKAFNQADYSLILNARTDLETFIKELRFTFDFVPGDLRDADTISRLAIAASDKDLDILINNAGIYVNAPLTAMKEEQIRETIEVNLMAPMLLTRAVWPVLVRKNTGLIVNINSLAGREATSPGQAAYCASKHVLRGFSEALQFDASRDGIEVIDVMLGALQTDMQRDRTGDWSKLMDPKEVAQTILSLCMERWSSRVTEVVICRSTY